MEKSYVTSEPAEIEARIAAVSQQNLLAHKVQKKTLRNPQLGARIASMTGYKTHLFICTNSPNKEGKCGYRGSEDLRKELKEQCKKEFGKEVRVNSAGCLGYCEHGIAAVIYPEGEWLLDLRQKDAPEILEKIREHQKKNSR